MVKISNVTEDASDLFDGGTSESPMNLDDLFGGGEATDTGMTAHVESESVEAVHEDSEGDTDSQEEAAAVAGESVEAAPGAHIQLAGCKNVHIHVNQPASGEQASAPVDDGKAAPIPELTPEQKFEKDVAYAKERFTNASMHVSELESQVKSLKSDLKDARETMEEAYDSLIELQERGPEQPKPAPSSTPQATESAAPQPGTPTASGQAPEPKEDNAWRNEPLTSLGLDKIDGLGKKKLEALMEAVPTMGAFVDLQSQAGAMGVHTLLPKGLGRKIADELEERQVEWLKQYWAKSAVQEPAEPMSVDHAAVFGDDPKPEESEAADHVPDDRDDIDEGNPVGEAEELPFGLPPRTEVEGEDAETQVRRRLNELAGAKNPSAPDIDIFREGRGAAAAGLFVTDCELEPGDDQDSWLLGFLSGGVKE